MSWQQRLLTPLSLLYGGAIGVRNLYYDGVRFATRRVAVPVISIGNLTVGGTGKTPLVIEVVRRLLALGRRPGILTRGYKARPPLPADEVLEFHEALPNVPVVANPDRLVGAAQAISAHQVDCLVLDDGFQHRRLARDLDVVLISALDRLAGERLLPAGRLREPLRSLGRATALVVTRANQVAPSRLEEVLCELRRWASDQPILTAGIQARGLITGDGPAVPTAALASRRLIGVCGIGQPETFIASLSELTGRPADQLRVEIFADHQWYGRRQLARILAAAQSERAELVVTTRKDWVKLMRQWPTDGPALARLDVDVTWEPPSDRLDALLRSALERRT